MIYGQDQAVRYPVKDLYDTGMMSMYIGAIKDEYERGLKEQEEFISKYGDFISPFKKDVETWDRLTMDPFVQAYDTMIANGIDPLRSQEGRALFASIRRHIPRETLSQLRQSAAAGQEYLKNRADLQSKGLYDPEFENFLLNGVQFDDYDTTKSGMWSRTSPTEFKGLRTLTDPWFKNRQAKYKYTKDGYDYYGYDVNDMMTITNDQIQAFLGNDYGKFYYDRALKVAQASRQPGESDESVRNRAKDILARDIVDANNDYLLNDRKANPYAMAEMEFRNQVRLAGLKRRWAKEDAAEQQRQDYPASWTGMLTDNINKERGDFQLNRLRESVQYLIDSNSRQVEKLKDRKDAAGKKQYKFHKAQADYYTKYLNNINAGKAGYSKDRFGNIHLSKFAEKAVNYYNDRKGISTVNGISDWANNNSFAINEPNSREWAAEFISTDKTQFTNNKGGKEDRYLITFGNSNNLSRVRTSDLRGKPLSSNSISKLFNKYLRDNHITGYALRTNINVSKTPRRNGGAYYDFTYYVDIPRSVIYDFTIQRNGGSDKADLTKADNITDVNIKRLGGNQYTLHQGTGENKESIEMVRIPVTTSATESELNAFQNIKIDKELYGSSNANLYAPIRQRESLYNSYAQ